MSFISKQTIDDLKPRIHSVQDQIDVMARMKLSTAHEDIKHLKERTVYDSVFSFVVSNTNPTTTMHIFKYSPTIDKDMFIELKENNIHEAEKVALKEILLNAQNKYFEINEVNVNGVSLSISKTTGRGSGNVILYHPDSKCFDGYVIPDNIKFHPHNDVPENNIIMLYNGTLASDFPFVYVNSLEENKGFLFKHENWKDYVRVLKIF